MQTAATSLPYGIHLGANQVRHELPGFSVSLLTPSFRAEDVPLHSHEHASFVFVLAGAYRSSADGAPSISHAQTLIFNPARTVHRDSFVRANGRFLAVSISEESRRVALDFAPLPPAATAFSTQSRIRTALRLAQQCATSAPASSSIMEALCWELLSTLSGVDLWPRHIPDSPPAWICQARELLQDRGSDAMTITTIAQQLSLHPVYFARAFRQVFHCTPGEYRMRCRLRDALASMRNPKLPLSEVALTAGFFDQSHFSTAFRKHFGMAPHAYRKQLHASASLSEVQFMQEGM